MTDDPTILPDTQVSVREVFGLDSDLRVPAFRAPDAHVPEVDPAYRFQHDVTLALLAGFAHNRRVLVQGLHGTGKSSHIEQVAARLNWPCLRVNLDGHVGRLDLIGKMPSSCAKASRSPSSRKASCRGHCNARSRWCSTSTTPAGPT
jgi:cobaltochelatase CobS